MRAFHRRLAELGLVATQRFGFRLASGSNACAELVPLADDVDG